MSAMQQLNVKPKRILYLDIIRILACFLVIVNHTNSQIFLNSSPQSATWFASVSYFYISKIAVPLFLMVSGVVLLCKEDNLYSVIKRLFRIALVLAIFTLLYCYSGMAASGSVLSGIKYYASHLYHGQVTRAFWYLYLYIGILMMLPFLQILSASMKREHYIYFFTISFGVVNLLPVLAHFLGEGLNYSSQIYLPLFGSYIGMLFAGYYIENLMHITPCKVAVAIFTLVLSIAFNVYMTFYEYMHVDAGASYLFLDNRTFTTIVLPSACAFICIKYLIEHINFSDCIAKLLSGLGACTFGIYLFSDYFINKLEFIFTYLEIYMHPLFAVVLFEAIVFIGCLLVTILLRKIPLVKKYI